MSRSYSLPTIKTLFGQALHCAYPECVEPLIFEDRGVSTVVAEIAHIRSESSKGPRHDPAFVGDINGAANLLLLCGKHHPAVDRHESIYLVAELLEWKARQVATAGAGTPISTEDAKRFVGLSAQEETALAQIARLVARVVRACVTARGHLDDIEAERQLELAKLRAHQGPIYQVNEDGSDVLDAKGMMVNIASKMQMSYAETAVWRNRVDGVYRADFPAIEATLTDLDGEVNVLRMMNTLVAAAANDVLAAAEHLAGQIRTENPLNEASSPIHAAIRAMWLAAHPND